MENEDKLDQLLDFVVNAGLGINDRSTAVRLFDLMASKEFLTLYGEFAQQIAATRPELAHEVSGKLIDIVADSVEKLGGVSGF